MLPLFRTNVVHTNFHSTIYSSPNLVLIGFSEYEDNLLLVANGNTYRA